MPRGRLPISASRLVSRRLRQLLLALQQKVEAIFHQGATTLCEAIEVSIASAIVNLDREERDRLLLPEEEDVVDLFIDESERSIKHTSQFHGFLRAFSIISNYRETFFRFDERGGRHPTGEQQLHLSHQHRRDTHLQRPQCQHQRQNLQERHSRPGNGQQPQGSGRRGGLNGPQPISGRSGRRSRSRRARRDGWPSDNPPPGPPPPARRNDLDRTPGRSHRLHHSGNTNHYCRCDHLPVVVQRPTQVIPEAERQESGQESQGHGRQQSIGRERAIDLRPPGRDGLAGPTGRSPPPSYRDVTRNDSAQPDLRRKLNQRDWPAEGDSAGVDARALCSSHGTQERPVPAPPRVVQQRQRYIPNPSSGAPPSQSLGAIPKQTQNPRQEPSRYEPRHLLPLVDRGEGLDRHGPQLILDAYPPGPCAGALTIVANNSHRSGDKNQRYCYQRLFMPNRHAAGTVLFVGADTFLEGHRPPAGATTERRPGDRAPRQGPPPIPAFEQNNRHAAADHQPVAANPNNDEHQSPIYEKIDDGDAGDAGESSQVAAHTRRDGDDEDGPGSPTVDLCSDDGATQDAQN